MNCKRCSTKEKKKSGLQFNICGYSTTLCESCRDEWENGIFQTSEWSDYTNIELEIKAKELARSTDEKAFFSLLKKQLDLSKILRDLARKFVNG